MSETQELLEYNEKLTLEPKLLKHFESDAIINGFGSYSLFLDEFKAIISPEQKIFYQSFYKDYVIYYCYLKYSRKAVFEYKLECRDGISLQQSLDNIKYNEPDIKVYQLPEDNGLTTAFQWYDCGLEGLVLGKEIDNNISEEDLGCWLVTVKEAYKEVKNILKLDSEVKLIATQDIY